MRNTSTTSTPSITVPVTSLSSTTMSGQLVPTIVRARDAALPVLPALPDCPVNGWLVSSVEGGEVSGVAGVVRGLAEFLLAGDHGVDRGLLHLLNPLPPRLSLGPPSLSLPALPPAEVAAATALRLVAVNLGNVALTVLTVVTVVTVVRVLELVVLQVVRALTGLQVSDVSPSHPA